MSLHPYSNSDTASSTRGASVLRPHEDLRERFAQVRTATEALAAPLSKEDCVIQSMDDASPVKWHLAHTTWFFETLVLERAESDFRPFHPQFRVLFNSYYQSVGAMHPRPRRGLLSRPDFAEVGAYRAQVDRRVDALFGADRLTPELCGVIELGIHHEQQHQELILTDVKHALSANPLSPAYAALPAAPAADPGSLRWLRFDEGTRWIGAGEDGFAFDNERPRHREFVEGFELASRLVSNAEFLAFIDDGGYREPGHWLSDGWAAVEREGWRAPLYWETGPEETTVQTLGGRRVLRLDEPVNHVSYYEADAFARWSGARLPREAEWEIAAAGTAIEGNFVESGRLHPAPAVPRGSAATQLFGDVWEWTRSPYVPYPGFRAMSGSLAEYNGKFMSNQVVLRGGSCATPQSHVRDSYRNFFYPDARWQFSGMRLARDTS